MVGGLVCGMILRRKESRELQGKAGEWSKNWRGKGGQRSKVSANKKLRRKICKERQKEEKNEEERKK